MSETATPFETVFELQRRSIDQNRQLLHLGVEVQKQVNQMALASVSSNKSLQHQGNEVARAAMEAWFAAWTAMVPGGDQSIGRMNEALEKQFEAADTTNAQFWDAIRDMMEEETSAYEELSDEYLEMVDEFGEDAQKMVTEAANRTSVNRGSAPE